MGKLVIFLVGTVFGAALMFAAQRYHVVRADDGVHLIPRITADFSHPYADIRGYGIADWNERRALALAIMSADKGALLKDSTVGDFRQQLEGAIDSLWPKAGSR